MQMPEEVKEKAHGDPVAAFGVDDPDAERGFQTRDLFRFFLVDIILVISMKLLLGLGVFPSVNAYVLAIVGSKVVLFCYLVWLIKNRGDAWPETGAAGPGRWWGWPAALLFYAAFYFLFPWFEDFNRLVMEWLHVALEWRYAPVPQDVIILIFEDVVDIPIRLVLVLFTVLIGPAMEELAFRGVGLDAFKRSWGMVWAIAITSLLFGLYHFSLHLLLPLSLLGVVFALVRTMTRSLWCSIGIHCLHNGLALTVTAASLGMLDGVEWARWLGGA